jgi:hypothetical protein
VAGYSWEDEYVSIQHDLTENYLDSPGWGTESGREVALWPGNGRNTQKWKFVRTSLRVEHTARSYGTTEIYHLPLFKIKNVHDGLCMDAEGMNAGPGSRILQYQCDPNFVNQPNQLWAPVQFRGGMHLISAVAWAESPADAGGSYGDINTLDGTIRVSTNNAPDVYTTPLVVDVYDGIDLQPYDPSSRWQLFDVVNTILEGDSDQTTDESGDREADCGKFWCLIQDTFESVKP